MNTTVNTIQIIRKLTPGIQGPALQEAIQRFNAAADKSREETMSKNADYRQGYTIGAYLHAQEEELDPKDLDQTAQELLDDLGYDQLPVNDPESFKLGVYNGYSIAANLESDEEETTP